jgi:hypothetical protein
MQGGDKEGETEGVAALVLFNFLASRHFRDLKVDGFALQLRCNDVILTRIGPWNPGPA